MKHKENEIYYSVTQLANRINISAKELNDIFIYIGFVRREKEYNITDYIIEDKGKKYGNQIDPDEKEGRNYYYVYYKSSILKNPEVLDILSNYNAFRLMHNLNAYDEI
ncbi:hypothetical protein [Sulfurimonas sp.]|uniref:hypothetical protein n=1 Tax=Sulfurimonas sp. TaxID=2022749 RepID=UPI002B494D83|nr:hypothetical protein [Sulfurimonas sp.]